MVNNHKIQEDIEKKAEKRERKRRPKLKVSGKEVFKLQSIILKEKGENKKK